MIDDRIEDDKTATGRQHIRGNKDFCLVLPLKGLGRICVFGQLCCFNLCIEIEKMDPNVHDSWEISKENIQPLSAGRHVATLNESLLAASSMDHDAHVTELFS